MFPSGKSRGRGATGSVYPVCIFLGLTLRTPCSQPAWSLLCYKPEVNRFYSSYKPVTKATVLISIINIHNSSSPAWQASWAILYKSWTLGIFMSCLQRSLVLWTLKTQVLNKRLDATWPPTGNWISDRNNWTHLPFLQSTDFYFQNSKILELPHSPESCLGYILRGNNLHRILSANQSPSSWLGQALAQFPEDCDSEGAFQRQGHI